MLLKIFRGTGPEVILLIIITLILLWLSAFIDPQVQSAAVYEVKPMPLYGVLKYLTGTDIRAGVILTFIILTVLLFLLVNFNTSVFFIEERTFLPAFIYVLFSSLLPSLQVLNPVLPALVFLLPALKRIMEAYRKSGTAFNFFDAALLISIGSLFYADLIWFGLLVFAGIVLLRSVNMIEIFISVAGLLTPYIMVFGIWYVIGNDMGILAGDLRENLFAGSPEIAFSGTEKVVLIFSGLLILVSTLFLFQQAHKRKIKSRKTFYLLLWLFIISLVLYFILPSASAELLWITAIPACYIISHYFIFVRKKKIAEVVFTGFFLLILVIQAVRLF